MLTTAESIKVPNTIELGLTTSKGAATFKARADILATCVLAGPQRLVMKVDKAVATTDGEVDPVASQVLEKVVVPVLVKWLEGLLLPELSQVIWDRLKAQVLTATVESGQINAYARVLGDGESSKPGPALPPTDMAPVAGAGRVRAVIREDVLSTALAILTPDKPFKAKDKAGCSGFSVKLKGSCDVKPVIRVKTVDGGAKVVIGFDVKRSDLDVKLDGDWGPLDFARKSLNKTVNAMLDDALELAAKFLSVAELPAFDLTRLSESLGLKVDVTADELGFREGAMYGQFTIREQH